MEYKQLGRTGLRVSPVVLGTVNFSSHTNEADSFAIMDRALELGINHFDTANNYNAGRSEALIGRWFAQGGGHRDKVVLATKVYCKPNEWGDTDKGPTGPNEHGLSATNIRSAVEASLKRLRTDHIDLYQTHHIDRRVPWEELWQAMELLVAQGKITYVGSSNYAGWHIAQAQEAARRRNSLGFASEQSIYNLANRSVELEVIPACLDYGMGLLAYSPLASGKLGGKADSNEGRRPAQDRHPKADAFEALCNEIGHPPGDVALAWVAHRPGVTAPIIGPRTMQQLEASVEAIDIELDAETLQRLDDLFPGPGPAPEAYAW